LKTDSYALETNVHFPTDLNLLWDSLRKCLDMIEKLQAITPLKGWRKIKNIRKQLKGLFRTTSHKVFKGKDEQQKKNYVKQYLHRARLLAVRAAALTSHPPVITGCAEQMAAIIEALRKYKGFAAKFTDQIERRLLKGETIPAEEKIYSIFEEHTEWLTKGKLNKKVELGHLLLITTDQYQFIVDYKVMENQRDAAQVSSLCERIREHFPGKKIYSHSFDKGFYSKENQSILQAAAIEQVILPKKGRHSKEDKQRESSPMFRRLRHAHSAVESNINMLEHHGLNRCMDKGLGGYKRCVGLSVLACNLHILGNVLKAIQLAAEQKSAVLKRAA
jgi:transposase, IS5 family